MKKFDIYVVCVLLYCVMDKAKFIGTENFYISWLDISITFFDLIGMGWTVENNMYKYIPVPL